MSVYDRPSLEKIIDFCSAGWREADQAAGLADDEKGRRKQTYNAVFHFAQGLLEEQP
jgi:hypothetical protein